MKNNRRNSILLVCLLLTLTIALSACSGDKGEKSSSSITIGIPQDIEESLDPHEVMAAGTKEILFNVYEGLYKPDSDGNLKPAVASDYAVSEDGRIYTFTLRNGIKFHDGSLVTVEDIQYSIEKCADIENGNPSIAAFLNIEKVNIIDDTHIEIVLKESDNDFLAYMSGVGAAIIPKSNEDPAKNAIGTGPYVFVSHTPLESIQMVRNEDYWGDKGYLETVNFKICANPDTITMELEGGSIDMFKRLTTSQVAQLDSQEFNVMEGTMNLVQALYLNNAVEPFNDSKVRQALCYAVDKEEVLNFVSDGKGTPIGSSMFPAFGKYYMEELNETYPYDIEKAKELLAEAGYPEGFTFSATVPSGYQQHIDTAQVLAQQLDRIGVTMQIQLVDWDTWLNETYVNRNFEATVIGVDSANMTAADLLGRFVSDADNNFVNYSNEEYDNAYVDVMQLTDDDARTQKYCECETILAETAANVYIQDLPEFVALRNNYAGYEFYPAYIMDVSKIYLLEEPNVTE